MGSKVTAPVPTSASILLLLMVAVPASLSNTAEAHKHKLAIDFYKSSCPNAETVITSAVNSALNERAAAAAGVLRIHFHDCFVRLSGGKIMWRVPLGRRDGLVSSRDEVMAGGGKLPRAESDVTALKKIFTGVALTTEEMVTLSGADGEIRLNCRKFND